MTDHELSPLCRAIVMGLLIVVLLSLPVWGYADLYSWTDETGVKHFSNEPPTNRSAKLSRTDEYVRQEKKQDPIERESTNLPKASDDRKKTVIGQKRTSTGPRVDIHFKYYDFVSVNINDIIGVMWKTSPVRHNGKSYAGNANYRITYNYYTREEDGTWYIDRVYTKVDVTFTMPRWTDYPKASRDQQQRWDQYYASLMEHENSHKNIAIEGAKALENELLQLYFTNEKNLKGAAKSRANRIFKMVRVRQQQFDEKTEHGHKTGANLRR